MEPVTLIPSRTYNHVAFKILEEDFDLYESRVRSLYVIKPSRLRLGGEGRLLYFYDYDNHLFELHTSVLVDLSRAFLSLYIQIMVYVRISAASGHPFRKHPDSVSELSGQHNGTSGHLVE